MKKILSRFFPLIVSGIVLATMVFSHSCANTTQAPTGGAKDSIPPVVVHVSPENYSCGIAREGTEIIFTFDEYVTIKTAQNIFLSPPQSKPPKSKLKGKSVIVTFQEPLDSNMTYTLSLADAIADNNEGNMLPGFTYVFSTGESVDSMMVTGVVQDCNTLDPVKGVTVMLYKDLSDSAVFKSRPFAAIKTDDWGFFCIRNIADEPYRLYAVKDGNNNNIYDPDENELVAFVDTVIRPVTVVNDSLPEVQMYEMTDTVSCLARKTEYELSLFREKPSKQMIMKNVRVTDRSSYITFNAGNAHIDTMWIGGLPAEKLITQFNIQRDSLEIWVNDKARQPDTLHLFVNYRKTDTLGNLEPFLEHVKLYYQTEEGSGGKKNSSNASKSSKKDLRHEDTICVFKLEAKPETIEQLGYRMEFTYPVINEAFDSLKLKSINPKQQESQMDFTVTQDTTNLRVYTIKPSEQLLPGYEYILKVPYRSFRDINGFYNDSTEVKVTLPSDEKLSTLNLVLTGVTNKYIIDLMSETRSNVVRQYIIDADTTLVFPYLTAAKYCIRITEDVNRNSIVDTGSLLDHRQPEKVLFYKVNDEMLLNIPEMSEIDQQIDIASMFGIAVETAGDDEDGEMTEEDGEDTEETEETEEAEEVAGEIAENIEEEEVYEEEQ